MNYYESWAGGRGGVGGMVEAEGSRNDGELKMVKVVLLVSVVTYVQTLLPRPCSLVNFLRMGGKLGRSAFCPSRASMCST